MALVFEICLISRLQVSVEITNQGISAGGAGVRSDYRYKTEKDLGFLVIL